MEGDFLVTIFKADAPKTNFEGSLLKKERDVEISSGELKLWTKFLVANFLNAILDILSYKRINELCTEMFLRTR